MDTGRGTKKKIKAEPHESNSSVYDFPNDEDPRPSKKLKKTPDVSLKPRKRMNRFDGLSDEEVMKRTLPDHIAYGLDVLIIGINPGLFAAYKGHHYAGPGNHFWKCLYLAGIISEPMTAIDDYKLLQMGIGFTNMITRATKGSADLSKKELRDGAGHLLQKLKNYRPKIAAFNGKLIYEAFTGKKKFGFGLQAEPVEGTDIKAFVMPSSSARCAQLPRATDKVPYYAALKKFWEHLNGKMPDLDLSEVTFPDIKVKTEPKEDKVHSENGDTRGSSNGSSNSHFYNGCASGASPSPMGGEAASAIVPTPKKKYVKKKSGLAATTYNNNNNHNHLPQQQQLSSQSHQSQPTTPSQQQQLMVEPPDPQDYDNSTLGESMASPTDEDFIPYGVAPASHDSGFALELTDPYAHQLAAYPFAPGSHHVVSPYFSTPQPPPVSTCNGSFAPLTPVSPVELMTTATHHPAAMYGFQTHLSWDNPMLQSQPPPLYGQQFLGSPTGMERLLTLTEIKQERPD